MTHHSLRLRALFLLTLLIISTTVINSIYNIRQLESVATRELEHEGILLADALTSSIISSADLENVQGLQDRVDRLAVARANQVEVNIVLLKGDKSFIVASNIPDNISETSPREHANLLALLSQPAPIVFIGQDPLPTLDSPNTPSTEDFQEETSRQNPLPTLAPPNTPPTAIPTALPSNKPAPPNIPSGQRFLSVTAPLTVNGQRSGSIGVKLSLIDLDHQIAVDRWNYVLAGVIETLTTLLFFGLLLDFQLLRPLARLAESMQKVAGGDLRQQISVERKDEIGVLARAFNGMTEQLLRARTQLHQYLNPLAVEEAYRRAETPDSKPLAQECELTFLFADIVAFTPLTEKLGPDRTVAFLNRYYDLIAGALVDYGGRIDKFVADEVVCLFDGEAQADHAVAAAREVLRRLTSNTAHERIQVRIGLNTGTCILADIGSPSVGRVDRTVIGDAVNVAQRLMTEATPNSALLSAETMVCLSQPMPDIRKGMELNLKGKTKTVFTFELQGVMVKNETT
jgi:class 3 adenylate cyclase